MRRKTGIIILIIVLAIGFAAVSTNLIVNGTGVFVTNEEDFKVIFSEAVIDGVDVTETAISEDGKTLTFTTSELAIKGEKSELLFEVRNTSTQYDAKLEMECVANGEHANNYYKIEKNIPEVISGGKYANGTVTVILNKTSVEEIEETFTCTITASATERESVAKESVKVKAVDENENDLNATSYVIRGEEADTLTASLLDKGYISSASDVNMLISVEIDDFDNIAYTTFDVSNIANEGESIVIFHYDEEKEEWEYIATVVVDADEKINSEFTSFSPIAFVKLDGNDNLITHTQHIDNNSDMNCDICTKAGKTVNVYHKHNSTCEKNCAITKQYGEIYDAPNVQNVATSHSSCGQTATFETRVPYNGLLGTHVTYHTYYTCGKSTSTIESTYVTFDY